MNFLRSWKTTLAGISSLLAVSASLIENPGRITDPQILASIIAGIGLLAAKDGNVSGKADATLDKKIPN